MGHRAAGWQLIACDPPSRPSHLFAQTHGDHSLFGPGLVFALSLALPRSSASDCTSASDCKAHAQPSVGALCYALCARSMRSMLLRCCTFHAVFLGRATLHAAAVLQRFSGRLLLLAPCCCCTTILSWCFIGQ